MIPACRRQTRPHTPDLRFGPKPLNSAHTTMAAGLTDWDEAQIRIGNMKAPEPTEPYYPVC